MGFWDRLQQWLAPPVYEEINEQRVGRLLNASALAVLLGAVLFGLFGVVANINRLPFVLGLLAVFAVLSIVTLVLMRNGYLEVASWIFVLVIWGGLTAGTVTSGAGVRTPFFNLYFVAIVLAGALLGYRGTILTGVLSVLVGGGLVLAEQQGVYVSEVNTIQLSWWIGLIIGFVVVGSVLYVTMNDFLSSLVNLKESNSNLRDIQQNLQEKVDESTRDLSLAVDVARRLSQVRDLNTLLSETVLLVQERFQLYYVQVYLTDEIRRNLVLRSGTGSVGNDLVQKGHRLTIGPGSINGVSAAEKRPVIVSDTRDSQIFRPNPLLPDTRAEMSVPLVVGEKVVGVLDLQNDKPGSLSEANLPTFTTLAGLLAVAIENAKLFSETIEAQAAVEAQARRLTQEGWREFFDGMQLPEYVTYTHELEGVEAESGSEGVVHETIELAGGEVGEIDVHTAAGQELNNEQLELVQAVGEQVIQRVENIRLLSQAERYRAEAELAARRLTREGWQTYREDKAAWLGYVYDRNRVVPLRVRRSTTPATQQAPLMVRGEEIGKLSLHEVEVQDQEEFDLMLSIVGEQLSAHIENLRLAEQTALALATTEEQAERLAQLNEMGAALATATNMEEVYRLAAEQIAPLLPNYRTTLTILDDSREQLDLLVLEGRGATGVGIKMPLENTLPNEVISQGRLILIEDTLQSLHTDVQDLTKQGIRSVVSAPLITRGGIIGTLNVGNANPNAFNESMQNLVRQIAALLAATIESRRLLELTQQRAERERLVNEISQRIQSTTNMESALQTTIQALGDALQAKYTQVQIYGQDEAVSNQDEVAA
ncbi:MAG TPA: GAF domain-containing protein [Anaerolineae bacterium]|nr:GAF domain-containing protein [Anaerolineae bacterium]